jgi:hypothetical protein
MFMLLSNLSLGIRNASLKNLTPNPLSIEWRGEISEAQRG